jgi:hypothetical protein
MNRKQGIRLRAGHLVALAGLTLLTAGIVMLAKPTPAQAVSSYSTQARSQYPGITGSALDSCALCHPAGGSALNPYAQDFANNNHSFTAIQNLDSDHDGYTNLQEINALTLPGDPASHPGSGPTATPTATRTRTPTATSTVQPRATATRTVAPTSTSTARPGATPTATRAASATSTARPGATPTATAGSPVPSPTPAPSSRRIAFVGTVSSLPQGGNHVGNWQVQGRTVRVAATTFIEQVQLLSGDGSDAVIWVLGTRNNDGSAVAFYIRVLQGNQSDNGGDAPTSK